LGLRNLGAYGGTEQASKTPAGRQVWLYEPSGVESYMTSPQDIRWTWVGLAWQTGETLNLDVSDDSGASWSPISGATAVPIDGGTFSWDVSGYSSGPLYRVRATSNQDAAVSDQSPKNFQMRVNGPVVFYVNNGSTANDEWCTAPGNDANDGASPATPKATVQALLATYDLEPTDVVRIDTGTYNLTEPIVVDAPDGGSSSAPVTFEASPYGVVVNRGSTATNTPAWSIAGDYVHVTTAASTKYPSAPQNWMKVTGAYNGVFVTGNNARLSRLDIAANAGNGVLVYDSTGPAHYATIENCVIRDNLGRGIYSTGAEDFVTVRNCTISGNTGHGIYLHYSNSATLENNIVSVSGSGVYGIYLSGTTTLATSDYNDLIPSGGANVGYASGSRATLAEWQAATGKDANSISVDPLFADAAGGDFHLESNAGCYDPGTGGWVLTAQTSPAIDAGDPTAVYPNEPLPQGDCINIGAYGNTEFASKTPLADVAAVEDGANEVIDLGEVFGGTGLTYTVTASNSVDDVVGRVSQDSYTHIHQDLLFTHTGDDRDLNGPEHDYARDNIETIFEDFGLATVLEPFTYSSQTYYNVVGEKTGAVNPNDVYIVGAHYDSVSSSGVAPGADDNASGTAAVMELARVLAPFQFESTIRFIAFDREEQGLKGSAAYATAHSGDNILGMVNLDMIGYDNAADDTVWLYDGEASDSYVKTDLIAALTQYASRLTVIDQGQSANSDHHPFDALTGVDAALIIEPNPSGNPHYHKPTDAVETADYFTSDHYKYATDITTAVAGYLATQAGLHTPPLAASVATSLLTATVSGNNLTLDYANDQNGVTDITVRATDTGGAWAEDTFTVTVTPDDDAPTVRNPIPDVNVNQNAPPTRVDMTSTFADEDIIPNADILTYTVQSNTNPTLVTPTFHGDDLVLTYAPGGTGNADITVRATDSRVLFVEDTFTVTVSAQQGAFHFDFGTSVSPVAGGFERVTHAAFDGTRGWQPGADGLGSLDRGTGTDLDRDVVYMKDGEFSVVLPTGTYDVTVRLGDMAYVRDE
jgi:parallel beta-helix repeat protein